MKSWLKIDPHMIKHKFFLRSSKLVVDMNGDCYDNIKSKLGLNDLKVCTQCGGEPLRVKAPLNILRSCHYSKELHSAKKSKCWMKIENYFVCKKTPDTPTDNFPISQCLKVEGDVFWLTMFVES